MKSLVLASMVAGSAPIDKVISLLAELKGKVQSDLKNEEKAMAEYTQFCDDEITEKGFAIKTAASDIERYQATIEESASKVDNFGSQVASESAEVAKKESELADANKVRDSEHSDFVAAEKELSEAVDMLSRAAVVLKRGLSLIQGKVTVKDNQIKNVVDALSAIVSSAVVDPAGAKKVKAFLESEDDLSLKQPQASVKNYESKSGGIVETIEDMKEKAQDNLNKLRREETNARHAHEMVVQSLQDAIENSNKEIASDQTNGAAASEAKAAAEGDLAKTQDAKAADEEYKKKMENECANKAAEWKARQASAADEMAAIQKAQDILAGGVKVLAQQKVSLIQNKRSGEKQDEDANRRDKVVSILRKLGRDYNSFGLMQMANSAGADPFGKVRGLIEGMISKLETQAAEEATHEGFCKSETAKSEKARETKSAEADKYSTRLDKANAAIAGLKQEIATLQGEVTAIDKASAEATKLRAEEKADNTKAAADFKASAEAVTAAIAALRDFYGAASFVQQPEFGSSSKDSSHVILEMLEVSQEDFSRLQAETETAETESQAAYEQLTQENKVSKSTKNASIKGKTSEVKSLETAVANSNDDLATVNKELDAVMEYLAKLKPQCESKAMTYEERKARRDAEISGLKEALEILEGDSVFLQKKAVANFLRKGL